MNHPPLSVPSSGFLNLLFYKWLLLGFSLTLLCVSALVVYLDYTHPTKPCQTWEKRAWREVKKFESTSFERVSARYWSSLCRENPPPLIISGSDGPGDPEFPPLLARKGLTFDQFQSAHRGTKTISYILAHDIHPERLARMKIVATISPMYFAAFAAKTDSASIRLTSLSTLSYLLRVPTWHLKWNEFLLLSPFIGIKMYLDEISPFFKSQALMGSPISIPTPPERPRDEDYNEIRQMEVRLVPNFTSFKSRLSKDVEPVKTMWKVIESRVNQLQRLNICVVMFPVNVSNLNYFGVDSERFVNEMRELINRIPETQRVDLLDMSYEPYIFRDPMHFTGFGKWRLIEEISQTPCFERVTTHTSEVQP